MNNHICSFKNKLVSDVRKYQLDDNVLVDHNTNRSYKEYKAEIMNEFLRGIQDRLRGIKFAGYDQDFYLYYPDDLFVRGFVSYGDVRRWETRTSDNDKDTYNVSTPFITNNKSDVYTPDVFFRLGSVNLKTALRNVSKYVRPYVPTDLMQITVEDFIATRNDVLMQEDHGLRMATRDAFGQYLNSDPLLKEMLRLVSNGYDFGYCDKEKLNIWAEKVAENAEIAKQGVKAVLVYVKTNNGEQEFTLAPIDNMLDLKQELDRGETKLLKEAESKVYTTQTLPVDLLGKVAVLLPAKDREILENIGYKHCEELYYVYA
tara:strand:+ start:54 stop:1001 length:948 start_codon:yes stop_codon:yes gene_type:complete